MSYIIQVKLATELWINMQDTRFISDICSPVLKLVSLASATTVTQVSYNSSEVGGCAIEVFGGQPWRVIDHFQPFMLPVHAGCQELDVEDRTCETESVDAEWYKGNPKGSC